MDLIDVSILLVMAVLVAVLFPNLLHDLGARIRVLRAGAVPLQRRGGYAAHSHAEAYSGPVTLKGPPAGNWRKFQGGKELRSSPGHRNFGVPPRTPQVDASAFTPFPDLR